jgi:hypothetical protein
MVIRFMALMLLALTMLGCGSGPAYQGSKRFALSGKVTLDGTPIDGGTISFISATKGNPAGGPISAGTYSISEEQGANEGSHRVQISWLKPTGAKVKDNDDTGEMIDVVKEVVPEKYNTKSELKAEVSAERMTFDFDLSSK